MATRQEREIYECFVERYRVDQGETARAIEKAVIGGDWGANGYTTMAQADALGAATRLRERMRLLDVGSGRGWPGLYLAKSTGCAVVCTDVPIEGLRLASARMDRERLGRRSGAVVATARHLPFPPATFDAIVHTDVLC